MTDDSSWRRRLVSIARLRTPSRRVRGGLLIAASVATVVAVVIAIDRLELTPGDLRPGPLLAAALLITPVTIALNAAELRVTALGSGARLDRVGWPLALRTVVLATAANLLPVPAGAILRVQVLKTAGAKLAAAAGVQLAAAGVWIGVSITLAAAALTTTGTGWAGVGLGAGVAITAVGLVALRRTATHRPGRAAAWLLAVESAMAVVSALRLVLVLIGIGVDASVAQALVIAAASPIAAAAGFFPGGIGLAELISALLAPLAGLAPAAGLVAVAVARILGLLVTVPVALSLGLRDLVRQAAAQEPLETSDGARTEPRLEGEA